MVLIKTDQSEGVEGENVFLTLANVEQFVNQHDPAFVKGYLQALVDFKEEAFSLVYKRFGPRNLSPRTAASVHQQSDRFHKEKYQILKRMEALGFIIPEKPTIKDDNKPV